VKDEVKQKIRIKGLEGEEFVVDKKSTNIIMLMVRGRCNSDYSFILSNNIRI